VGLHLFDEYLENQNYFADTLQILKQSITNYLKIKPDDSWFPILTHRDDTLLSRFKALFYAPLLGIGKLTEFDYKQHCLEKIISKTYQSSTLTQFLCGLERIDAGQKMLELLIPSDPGKFSYIDGHMIAFWSTQSMHKGKITMLGRIMSGSNALVAHDEKGRAIYIEYHPPDIRMPGMILQYCQHIANTIGIELFVIDREVNSLQVALDFEDNGLGLLSMLNNNQYKALSDWDYQPAGALKDGSKLYTGQWRDEKKRREDPRHFVIIDNGERLLPYWGNAKMKADVNPVSWPEIYSERTEIQENSFKRMKSHGALEINYGTKKIWGPDRHQQRVNDELTSKIELIQAKKKQNENKIEEQKVKIEESKLKKHPKLLSTRQSKLKELEKGLETVTLKEQKIQGQIEQNGHPRQRADRDFRKQMVMTIRTLCLENCLVAFLTILLQNTTLQIGLDSFIEVFSNRSGSYYETSSSVIYNFYCKGMSKSYIEKMQIISNNFNALKLTRNGKLIQAKMRAAPT